ncbi:MFS transporter [Raineyella fluvialis]|uniref:MFS transporter n=1 Tax=Raineyella fluvialis TaxID=2662261 RepID=A0A5Q2FF15_9ACTN|nr:MFS transporter [Raineyella fluvialis]QGF23693.1 MFS transporter [Raineyella fluvialis]
MSATPPLAASTVDPARQRRDSRRAQAASFLGTTVEFYDFLLYASAAGLVFPKVFFGQLDPRLGATLSFVILLSGYLARPLGGLVFGHFGDRFGRKNVLFVTLLLMGLVSVGIGLLPTYGAIGIAAPLALVGLRVIQGLAMGGEWGGATLMSMEHAGEKSRGLGASIATVGGPAGAVLATVVLALFSRMPDAQFLDWGWRIPFLMSAVIVLIGLYLRLRVTESPDFQKALEAAADAHDSALPLATVVTKFPGQVILGTLAGAAPLAVQGLLGSFMVPFVVSQHIVDRQSALLMLAAGYLAQIPTLMLFAHLSDRFGRRPVMIAAGVVSAALIFPVFGLFTSRQPVLVLVAFLVGLMIVQSSMFGPLGAFLSEKFSTEARYTGASLSYQLGSIAGAGTIPLIATSLVTPAHGLSYLGWYMIGLFVLALAAVLLSRETAGKALPGSVATDRATDGDPEPEFQSV